MGLSRRPENGKVVNLTNKPVWVYSVFGDIICLEPSWSETGDYYLVSRHSELEWPNLVIALEPSRGRDGAMLSRLVLKSNPKVRVYPTEG